MLKPAAPAALVGRGRASSHSFSAHDFFWISFRFSSPFLVEYLAIKHLALTSLISLSSLFAKVE